MSTKSPATLQRIQDLKDRLRQFDISEDAETFAIQAARKFPSLLLTGRRSSVVVALMVPTGWTQRQGKRLIEELISVGVLFVSASGKSIAFRTFTTMHPSKVARAELVRCVYCGRRTRKITKDHVIPVAQSGSDDIANIVLACKNCNQSKGNRTPEQWAKDILDYRKPPKPLRRLPMRYRVRLAVASITAAVVAVLTIGGAK